MGHSMTSRTLYNLEIWWFDIQFKNSAVNYFTLNLTDFIFNLISHLIWFHIHFDFTFNLTISHSIWLSIFDDLTFNLISHSIWRFHIQIDIHFLERPSRPPRPFQWLRQHSLTSRCLSAASGQSGWLLVTRIICFSLSLFIYFIWYLTCPFTLWLRWSLLGLPTQGMPSAVPLVPGQ